MDIERHRRRILWCVAEGRQWESAGFEQKLKMAGPSRALPVSKNYTVPGSISEMKAGHAGIDLCFPVGQMGNARILMCENSGGIEAAFAECEASHLRDL